MNITKVAEVVFIGSFFMLFLGYLVSALIVFYWRAKTKHELELMNQAHVIAKDRLKEGLEVVWNK